MDVSSSKLRSVEIRPPSARAETWNVLRVAALLVLATWIYLADTAASRQAPAAAGGARVASGDPMRGGGGARDLMPYQRLFRTLDGEDQRIFRELQEGLIEAENVRAAAHRWPAAAALAAQGIPPFAGGPARGGRRGYHWEMRQEGLYVNYLGLPADRRDPAFLLLVQEPDPQAPPAGPPGQPILPGDEIHHRLEDGTILHVSTWMLRPGGAGAADAAGRGGVIAEPFARGWTQLLIGAPRP
jgi:hypothetical protein